ncbi:MAG: ferrous iron transport protein A [Chlorobiaceae bacterium]|nr:ferrous iron transport protein A [Chlorobiaceae bacterium]NTW09787.1 ferrous iron transport protein A [Chlorobiaceae bacterium]
MRLSELRVGDTAEVKALKGEHAVRRRIMDLGLTRGTSVRVLRVAPLGDPVEICFKGMYLALRKNEAQGILVEKPDEDGSFRMAEACMLEADREGGEV